MRWLNVHAKIVNRRLMYILLSVCTKEGVIQTVTSQILRIRLRRQRLNCQTIQCEDESNGGVPFQDTFAVGNSTCISPESQEDTGALQAQLRNNLVYFFISENAQSSAKYPNNPVVMVVHVSEVAIQDIVENLSQIFSLSIPLVRDYLFMNMGFFMNLIWQLVTSFSMN